MNQQRPAKSSRDRPVRPTKYPPTGYKPELLAPAGNREALVGAVRAGADAVYLGLTSFNARDRAANFSFNDYLVARRFLQQEGVKLHLALNTLIKPNELETVRSLLDRLNEAPPDALILQDLGLTTLCRRLLPGVPRHGSTQMSIHNSAGLHQLKQMGFSRVILARECTLDEIKAIATRQTDIGIEVFIHGALCFSLSGQCLFSSYLGGMSANRGKCTQPCRRLYTAEGRTRPLFSTTDLNGMSLVKPLIEAGVAALKIEGRLKPAPHVYEVTRRYREIIDALAAGLADEAMVVRLQHELDALHGSRRSSTGFFHGDFGHILVKGLTQEFSGTYAGTVLASHPEGFVCEPTVDLETRYRLLVYDPKSGKRTSFRIDRLTSSRGRPLARAAKGRKVVVHTNRGPFCGGARIYITESDKALANRLGREWKAFAGEQRIEGGPIPTLHGPDAGEVSPLSTGEYSRESLLPRGRFARIERLSWLDRIGIENYQALVILFTQANVSAFSRYRRLPHEVFWEIPAMVFETDLKRLRRRIRTEAGKGPTHWVVHNLAHLSFFDGIQTASLVGGYRLNIANPVAAASLLELGLAGFTLSVELDRSDLSSWHTHPLVEYALVYVSGRPDLLLSRVPLNRSRGLMPIDSERGERFNALGGKGFTRVMAQRPLDLRDHVPWLEKLGFSRFVLDFGYTEPTSAARVEDTTIFNLRRSWK